MLKGGASLMGSIVKLALVLLAACVAGLLLVGSARGEGVGIVPGIIKIDDAVRGGEYTKLVTLINEGASEVTFQIAKDGEAATWASLHPLDDPEATLDTVVVPANDSTRVLLQIAVPPDAANGVENGVISFQSVVTEQGPAGEARVRVKAGVNVQLSVTVGGAQNLSGEVLDAYADDVEVGSPALIKTKFLNTGNVEARPEIKAVIKDSSGGTLGEATPGDTATAPGQTSIVDSQWDTSGRDLGKYTASVTVTLSGNQIYNRDVSFDIVAVGTLQLGVLQRIALENSPQPGEVADIAAYFENRTRTETGAVFVAEVYRGDELVDAITTPEQSVGAGEVAPIKTTVNVEKEGKYTIRGKVTFGGKETESKELVFKVGGGGLPIWAVASGGILAVAVVLAIGALVWGLLRRRSRQRNVTTGSA